MKGMRTTTVAKTLVIGCCLLVAACGSGGGGGGGTTPQTLPENSMRAATVFGAADVDHLLGRTAFGINPTTRAAALAMGLPAYVDSMLEFPTTSNSPVETAARDYLVNATDPVGLEGKFPSNTDITDWWLYLMLRSEHPFRERLAMFWHDHFAISSTALRTEERYLVVDYLEKLRQRGIGNFRSLVLDMSRDGAMLEWLDGSSSVKAEPNENFAREFFELFTVGADRGYTELDIQEASRAFTGYRNRLDTATNLRVLEFDGSRKDVGTKVLFGDVILESRGLAADDYDLVVNATFLHLDVASWLAEKLLLEFVTDEPSSALIANLAAEIRARDYEMKPVLRTLFLSEAFYLRKKQMIRMPVDYGIGLVRATNLMVTPEIMRSELFSLAQVPGDPPSVFGWPQGDEWLSAAGMVERANLARRLIGERTWQAANGFAITMPAGVPDAAAVVDWFTSLMAIELSLEERTALITYLDTNVPSPGVEQPDPFDPANPQDISNRVRGLVWILANHPDALRR
jgi:uncharacterized protein (DUF1800 family)